MLTKPKANPICIVPSNGVYSPLSSSEEDDHPPNTRFNRIKPNRKNQKYKAQLISSLIASLSVFLVVMVAIVSIATSHSANKSQTTASTSRLTTMLENFNIDRNYEDLANPKDIMVEEMQSNDTELNVSSKTTNLSKVDTDVMLKDIKAQTNVSQHKLEKLNIKESEESIYIAKHNNSLELLTKS